MDVVSPFSPYLAPRLGTLKTLLPPLLLLLSLLSVSQAFECFTGDQDILRRKQCPSFGEAFTDRCFKKIGEQEWGYT